MLLMVSEPSAIAPGSKVAGVRQRKNSHSNHHGGQSLCYTRRRRRRKKVLIYKMFCTDSWRKERVS